MYQVINQQECYNCPHHFEPSHHHHTPGILLYSRIHMDLTWTPKRLCTRGHKLVLLGREEERRGTLILRCPIRDSRRASQVSSLSRMITDHHTARIEDNSQRGRVIFSLTIILPCYWKSCISIFAVSQRQPLGRFKLADTFH